MSSLIALSAQIQPRNPESSNMEERKTEAQFWEELREVKEEMTSCSVTYNAVQQEAKETAEFVQELAGVANTVKDHIDQLMTRQNNIMNSINELRTSAEQHFFTSKPENSENEPKEAPLSNTLSSRLKTGSKPKKPLSTQVFMDADSKENQDPTTNHSETLKKQIILASSAFKPKVAELKSSLAKNLQTGHIHSANEVKTKVSIAKTDNNQWIKPKNVCKSPSQEMSRNSPSLKSDKKPKPEACQSSTKDHSVQKRQSKLEVIENPVISTSIVPDHKKSKNEETLNQTILAPQTVLSEDVVSADSDSESFDLLTELEKLALKDVPTDRGSVPKPVVEKKTKTQLKKERKQKQEKEKQELRIKRKAEKLEAQKRKEEEEIAQRESIRMCVMNTIKYLKCMKNIKIDGFTLEMAGKFVDDRLNHYKCTKDVEMTHFYTFLQKNLCVPALTIIRIIYSLRNSGIRCCQHERAVLEDMKSNSVEREMKVETLKAQWYVELLIPYYMRVQEMFRYSDAPIPETLLASQGFMELHSLWKLTKNESPNRNLARNAFMHLASHHERNQQPAFMFAVAFYKELAKSEKRVVIEDGCILAGMMSRGAHNVNTFYFSVLMAINKWRIDGEVAGLA